MVANIYVLLLFQSCIYIIIIVVAVPCVTDLSRLECHPPTFAHIMFNECHYSSEIVLALPNRSQFDGCHIMTYYVLIKHFVSVSILLRDNDALNNN